MNNISFSARLRLHNAQVELEALKSEGRGMIWENEQRMQGGLSVLYREDAFNKLAVKMRATKLEIQDTVLEAMTS
jgi:hypothetical protein